MSDAEKIKELEAMIVVLAKKVYKLTGEHKGLINPDVYLKYVKDEAKKIIHKL